ncbi:MAG: HAD-IIA family hydrolase [Bacteroidales bacterium]|nr:HAD-IIA family hydrolase [Bacteroidales bacterium]
MKAIELPHLHGAGPDRLRRIRHVALDMDGTIYLGSRIFPWTLGFLDRLRSAGIGFSFLTNNPTRSVDDYLKKLAGMGIQVGKENMYSTPIATIDYIRKTWPQARRLFMLGTPSMAGQFEEAGFTACTDDPDDVPDVLVVAFDTTLVYSRLCRAAWWAAQGVPYVATNPDWVCPTDRRTILVDCGSLQKCIEAATGRRPDKVLGKPDPTMLDGIRDRYGLAPDEIAMVGDRIYTDIAMGHNAGALSVLVLSGETTLETALQVEEDARNNPAPVHWPADVIVRDIASLGDLLTESRRP